MFFYTPWHNNIQTVLLSCSSSAAHPAVDHERVQVPHFSHGFRQVAVTVSVAATAGLEADLARRQVANFADRQCLAECGIPAVDQPLADLAQDAVQTAGRERDDCLDHQSDQICCQKQDPNHEDDGNQDG